MADFSTPLPYGVRDLKLTPYTDQQGTTLGTPIDLPYVRTLTFTDSVDTEELRGDDQLVTIHEKGVTVDWELESGGISFEAFRTMAGGVTTTSGTGSTQTKVFAKNSAVSRPFFRIEGQVISDSGGDVHVIIPRAKATGDLSGEFNDGEFFLTSAEGTGFPALVAAAPVALQDVYVLVQNMTPTPIASS